MLHKNGGISLRASLKMSGIITTNNFQCPFVISFQFFAIPHPSQHIVTDSRRYARLDQGCNAPGVEVGVMGGRGWEGGRGFQPYHTFSNTIKNWKDLL